jgi:hypothetical protein
MIFNPEMVLNFNPEMVLNFNPELWCYFNPKTGIILDFFFVTPDLGVKITP